MTKNLHLSNAAIVYLNTLTPMVDCSILNVWLKISNMFKSSMKREKNSYKYVYNFCLHLFIAVDINNLQNIPHVLCDHQV